MLIMFLLSAFLVTPCPLPMQTSYAHSLPGHQVKKERENESEKGREGERARSRGRRTTVNVPQAAQAHATKDVPSLCPMLRDTIKVDIGERIGWNVEDSVGGKQGRKVDTMRPRVKVNWPQGEAAKGQVLF